MSCCCPIWGRPRSKGASTWARRSSSTSRPSSTVTRRRIACWKPCSESPGRLYIRGVRHAGPPDHWASIHREQRIMDRWQNDDHPNQGRLNRDRIDPRRHKTLRTVLLKVLLPLAIVGGSVAVLIVLHLDGTLRMFLDRQGMFGMIAVVLVLNLVGFAFIYMLSMVWKSVKHDLLHLKGP